MELTLLATTLGARDLFSIYPYPHTRFIREGLPAPGELLEIMAFISGSMVKALRLDIRLEAFYSPNPFFKCHNILDCLNVDYQGNLVLCCNLSHVTPGGWSTKHVGAGMAGEPPRNFSKGWSGQALSRRGPTYGSEGARR